MDPRLQKDRLNDQTDSQDSNKLDLRNEIQESYGTRAAPWFEWVFDQLDFPRRAEILELGCGTGALWQANHKRIPAGWRLTLTDMDAQFVRSAQDNLKNISRRARYLSTDSQSLPFPDDNYDVVLAVGLLDLVPDVSQTMAEVRRMLRSSGQFVTTAGGVGHLKEMEDLIEPFVPQKQARMLGGDEARFGLENGRQQLSPFFDEIDLREYRDTLVFTDLQPVLDYLLSELGILQSLTLEQMGQLVQRVKRRLEKFNAIEVTVRKGIFIAR